MERKLISLALMTALMFGGGCSESKRPNEQKIAEDFARRSYVLGMEHLRERVNYLEAEIIVLRGIVRRMQEKQGHDATQERNYSFVKDK